MYANYEIPMTPTAAYQQVSEVLTSSTKKAWESITISVTNKEDIDNGHITREMIEAQELALSKIWDTPENNVWDDCYKELND